MKKILATIVGATLLCTPLTAAVQAAEAMPITVYIDGQKVDFDVDPITEADRTLVPMRAIFEDLGAMVEWDEETQTASATRGDITISFTIDQPIMLKNGMPITLDVPARKIDDRTLVPLRAVSEAFSCRVDWNEETQKVSISTTPASVRPDDETKQYMLVHGFGEHPTLISDKDNNWFIALPNDWTPALEEDGNMIYYQIVDGSMQTLYVQIRDAGDMTQDTFAAEIQTTAKSRLDLYESTGCQILSSSGPETVTVNGTDYLKTQSQRVLSDQSRTYYETTYFLLSNGFLFEFGYSSPTADTSVIDKVLADSVF